MNEIEIEITLRYKKCDATKPSTRRIIFFMPEEADKDYILKKLDKYIDNEILLIKKSDCCCD